MFWSRPAGAWAPPLGLLLLATAALAFNVWGWETALSEGLFAHYRSLTGAALLRPAWGLPAEAAWLAVFGGLSLSLLRFGLVWTVLVLAAAMAVGAWASWYFFAAGQLLVDAATPDVGLGALLVAVTYSYIRHMRLARLALRMAFADSLPRATIEKIARRPELLKVDGEIRNVTYLVCGVRGLGGMAAAFRDDPAAFTQLLQRVLTPLMDQALAHGGTIDRLTADGFAAFWNAPLADNDHATHACEAGNGMAIMAHRVNEGFAQIGGREAEPVEIGVGIATGSVIAGGFGGHGRMGYSVNGDAVVLAGRIQALSSQYGPSLIVADETRRQAERAFAFLEVDTVAAGADDPPVTLYAIMGNPVMRASPKFRALTTFHDHIFQALRKQQWDRARELIEQCRRLSGASQKLYDLHLNRIAYFEHNPPGEQWDGAFRPVLK